MKSRRKRLVALTPVRYKIRICNLLQEIQIKTSRKCLNVLIECKVKSLLNKFLVQQSISGEFIVYMYHNLPSLFFVATIRLFYVYVCVIFWIDKKYYFSIEFLHLHQMKKAINAFLHSTIRSSTCSVGNF